MRKRDAPKYWEHRGSLFVRTVVFATGVERTSGGDPSVPVHLPSVRRNGSNGAPTAVHSSQMASARADHPSLLRDAGRIFVVGAGKAGIDILSFLANAGGEGERWFLADTERGAPAQS